MRKKQKLLVFNSLKRHTGNEKNGYSFAMDYY